jgi:hypothetical protein
MVSVSFYCAGAVDNSLAAERHKANMEKTFPKAGKETDSPIDLFVRIEAIFQF